MSLSQPGRYTNNNTKNQGEGNSGLRYYNKKLEMKIFKRKSKNLLDTLFSLVSIVLCISTKRLIRLSKTIKYRVMVTKSDIFNLKYQR